MAPNQRMYQTNTDQNGASSSMMPQGLGKGVFSNAKTPAPLTKQLNPSHIFINATGSYYFKYDSTTAIGASETGGYELGMRIDNMQSPVRLDIQPCAWSGSGFATKQGVGTGAVTFVYRGQ
jgi:hypothetical protein